MTPERAKELLPILQAFAEGKKIQTTNDSARLGWWDVKYPCFRDNMEYRIKPEPVYGWICIVKSNASPTGYVNSSIFASEHAAKAHAEQAKTFHKIVKIRLDNTDENLFLSA